MDIQVISTKTKGVNLPTNIYYSAKKPFINLSTAESSIENFYVPCFLEDSRYAYRSREISNSADNISMRVIECGKFLHRNQVNDITNDCVLNVGCNKFNVQFLNAAAANSCLTNPILNLCKYVAVIPTFNITRILKEIRVEFLLDWLVV